VSIAVLATVLFAAGVFLIYDGLTQPARLTPAAREPGRVDGFLARAGLGGMSPRGFVVISLGAGFAAGITTYFLLQWVLVSLLAAFVGLSFPLAYYLHRHEQRTAALQVALVEATEQLRDSIRAGLSVPESLVGLSRTGPESLRPEFATLVRELRLDGFEAAIQGMKDRVADPLWDLVATSLVLNDRVGGRHVTAVLDRLTYATRAQLRIQDEVRAYQARNVLSARIVAAVPILVLVAIRSVSPAYLAVFDAFEGQLILAGCVVAIAVGYVAMLALTRLAGERRVLR
jgi:tight adherence protein B